MKRTQTFIGLGTAAGALAILSLAFADEANRAMRHLGLGRWHQIVFEAETASVAMAPSGGGVLLVAAPRSVPRATDSTA